jgi:choline dehydrogenase-like flavoprotein
MHGRNPEPASGTSPEERKDRREWLKKMQDLLVQIKDKFFEKPASEEEDSEDLPTMKLADFGVVAHEVGTMRMSRDEHDVKGVVDKNLKYIGVDNLYVCDLSVFPVSPPANPTLTLAALALRLADYLKNDSEIEPWESGEMPHGRKEDKWTELRAGKAKL